MSPLYSIYEDDGMARGTRNVINGSITIKPVKNLQIVGRVSYDVSHSSSDSYTVPRWDDSNVVTSIKKPNGEEPEDYATKPAGTYADWDKYYAYEAWKASTAPGGYLDPNNYQLTSDDIRDMSKSSLGSYSATMGRSQLFTAGANISYKVELPKDFSIDLMAGTELKMSEGFSMSNYGVDFIIPGTYSLSNTNKDEVYLSDRTASHSIRRRFGYFGEIRADYKGLASLSVTGRWDWSSTINKNPFFYPSVTAGIILSELIPGLNETKNNWFSYWKLRGNYAVVGKDAPAFLYDRRFKQWASFPDGGYGIDAGMSSATLDLMPEMSYSWEIGMDVKFFDNRTRLDVAYYNTKVDNQIVTVRVSPSSGYILQTRNEGAITNQGVEITLDQDIIKRKNFN
jgi:outer membrane receptor protein involved in Fe transport